jgi:hypothetical protein
MWERKYVGNCYFETVLNRKSAGYLFAFNRAGQWESYASVLRNSRSILNMAEEGKKSVQL